MSTSMCYSQATSHELLKETVHRKQSSSDSIIFSDGVYGIISHDDKKLVLSFEVSDPAICLNIYKDSILVISTLFDVNAGDTKSFFLYPFGKGKYRAVLYMDGEKNPLVGYFSF